MLVSGALGLTLFGALGAVLYYNMHVARRLPHHLAEGPAARPVRAALQEIRRRGPAAHRRGRPAARYCARNAPPGRARQLPARQPQRPERVRTVRHRAAGTGPQARLRPGRRAAAGRYRTGLPYLPPGHAAGAWCQHAARLRPAVRAQGRERSRRRHPGGGQRHLLPATRSCPTWATRTRSN
ncbi:hypothetical protein LP419_13230 [Massilia sp. H-1]|nr:hypothetical protein LP419_13230 [Massilia sp. H-1]